MHQRKGQTDTDQYKQKVIDDLNWQRGEYLQLGFDIMIFIYDVFEPWYHHPEYDAHPIHTWSYTNVGDTVNVAYFPHDVIGRTPESESIVDNILAELAAEYSYIPLYRTLKRDDFYDRWKQTESNYSAGVHEEFEGYTITKLGV